MLLSYFHTSVCATSTDDDPFPKPNNTDIVVPRAGLINRRKTSELLFPFCLEVHCVQQAAAKSQSVPYM